MLRFHHQIIINLNFTLHRFSQYLCTMPVTYIYSFYNAIFKHTLNIYLFNIWIAINVQNCRVDAALIAALMCTIHCWLIFCISPHPGTMGPPYTIGRAKHDDNAMRSALVSIRSDGSDLQLLPSLAICPDQFRAEQQSCSGLQLQHHQSSLAHLFICGNLGYLQHLQSGSYLAF